MRWTLATQVCLLALAACGGDEAEAPPAKTGLEHDFGTIVHGQRAEFTFDVPLDGDRSGRVPRGFTSSCSCAQAVLSVVPANGPRRTLNLPLERYRLHEGDRLELSLTLDTAREEPVDRPTKTVRGEIHIGDGRPGAVDTRIPVIFHYGIDAPIDVHPMAHVDFGRLPLSRKTARVLQLKSPTPVQFGEPTTDDPRIEAKLDPATTPPQLHLAIEPGKGEHVGPVKFTVRIPTDRSDGYTLEIAASGEIISDVEIEPFTHMSFGRFDMAESTSKFLNVFDHDLSREPGFAVLDIRGADGRSLAEHFRADLEPLDGDERGTRLHLTYLGTLPPPGFRGSLTLTKPGQAESIAEISFVGFHQQP